MGAAMQLRGRATRQVLAVDARHQGLALPPCRTCKRLNPACCALVGAKHRGTRVAPGLL